MPRTTTTNAARDEEVRAGQELLAIRLSMLAYDIEVKALADRLGMPRARLSEVLHGRRPSSRAQRLRIMEVILGGAPAADETMGFRDEDDLKPVWPVRAHSLTWSLSFDEADARSWSAGEQAAASAGGGAGR